MNNIKELFDIFLQTNLNAEQKMAVTPNNGSFLVIAGAGSGKTRVITARITNLILEHGIEPSSIIALTFTNKAAQEMQHRIEKFLPYMTTKPIIATFHSYCLRLLKTNIRLLNKETFTILDATDQHKLIQNLIKEHGVSQNFNAKTVLSNFSTFKMNTILKIDQLTNIPDHHLQKFMELYNAYEKQKHISNYFDFDDLLYQTYDLFATNSTFQTQHQNRHRHILVDEYQDTNIIQHELLKKMTLFNNKFAIDSVCAVGDEDQSIYSWRGATIKNILEFDQEFPKTTTIKLEQNYRSTQRILDIANHVINNNSQRKHKKLWSDQKENHTPLQLECLSDLQEAYAITNSIKVLNTTDQLSDIAILYRTHYQSRIIEEALIKDSIPYKIIGGIQFYERKEIKDLIAYLRLVVNPFDKISFSRIINCPLRGFGEKFEEQFLKIWNEEPFSNFINISQKLINEKLITTKQIITLKSFINLFDKLSDQSLPENAIEQFIKKTEYIIYLQDNFDKVEAQTKKENVLEFIRAAQYSQAVNNTNLSSFLEDIAIMQEHMTKDKHEQDCVQMMTLHSAKGLEFNSVILSGIEDGIIPSNQSIENGNIEEERRLFYVGLTRARKKLILFHTKYRNTFGQMVVARPSRFLQEIPSNFLQQEEAKHWSKSQFTTFFTQWNNKSSIDKSFNKPIKKINNFNPPLKASSFQKINESKTQTIIKQQLNNEPKFKRLESVKHQVFGTGIIQLIEIKGDKTFITIHFIKHGKKKIESSFLEKI